MSNEIRPPAAWPVEWGTEPTGLTEATSYITINSITGQPLPFSERMGITTGAYVTATIDRSIHAQLANAKSEIESLKATIKVLKEDDHLSRIISGALIDLINYINSRPGIIKIGKGELTTTLFNMLTSFCVVRGIKLHDNPMTSNWNDSL